MRESIDLALSRNKQKSKNKFPQLFVLMAVVKKEKEREERMARERVT